MSLSSLDIGLIGAAARRFNYNEAFKRNLGLVTEDEQERLKRATVGIAGLGGVGGIHLMTLTRMGIGNFHIADADTFDLVNFNRQYGAFVSTIGSPKTGVMKSLALEINPELNIKVWNEFIAEKNAGDFLRGCDVVLDGIDAFSIDARHFLYTKARELKIPVIAAGPLGFSVSMLVFTPESLSFDEYFGYRSSMTELEKMACFIIGNAPRPFFLKYMDRRRIDMQTKSGPSIASAVVLCSGFAATEAFKLILKRGKVYAVPYYHYYDPFLMKFIRGYLWFGARNPLQRIKRFLFEHSLLK